MPRKDDIWENIEYFPVGAELTPFMFKGEEHYLLNFSPAHDKLPEGTREHAKIFHAATGKCGARSADVFPAGKTRILDGGLSGGIWR